MSDLSTVPSVKIPRYINSINMHDSSVLPMLLLEHMLLMFTWVVQLAVYLVFSNSKIAPVKQVTLPRLELLGVLICV